MANKLYETCALIHQLFIKCTIGNPIREDLFDFAGKVLKVLGYE